MIPSRLPPADVCLTVLTSWLGRTARAICAGLSVLRGCGKRAGFPVESKVSCAALAESRDFLASSTLVWQLLTLCLKRGVELLGESSVFG